MHKMQFDKANMALISGPPAPLPWRSRESFKHNCGLVLGTTASLPLGVEEVGEKAGPRTWIDSSSPVFVGADNRPEQPSLAPWIFT